MFLTVLIFLAAFNVQKSNQNVVECSQSGTPDFTIDNFATLQSPSFPQALNNTPCNVHIKAANPNNQLWISMLTGAASTLEILDDQGNIVNDPVINYSSNFDYYFFYPVLNSLKFTAFSNDLQQNWMAFQAVVLSYDPSTVNSTCPFSSQTFDFNADPNLVISVAPTFYRYANSKKLCNWVFKVGASQQLKVVVKAINLSSKNLVLSADGAEVQTFTSVYDDDSTTVSYFDGSVFNLNYQNNDGSFDRFVLFISAVSKSNTFTSNGCQPPQVIMSNQTSIFTNIDNVNGYPSYQRCQYSVNIPAFSQGSLGLYQNDYDADSDFLTLTSGNTNVLKWTGSLTPEIYTVTSDINGAILAFNSDGNTNGAGFKAVLQTYECACGPSSFVANCNSTVRITPLDNNWYYCDNIACTYQLTSDCPDAYFHLYPVTDGLRDSDYIILKDDGKIVQNITSNSVFGDINNHYLMSNTYNLEFHSGAKSDVITGQYSKRWYINVEPIYPKFTTITLNKTSSSFVFWLADLKNHDVISVCSSTGKLEMFISSTYSENELDFYKLFDDKGLNNFIGSLKTALPTSYNPVPRNLKSASGCFSLYLPDDNYNLGLNHTILFKAFDETSSNCENDVSVFQAADSHSISYTISINSTSAGSCKATILSHITASATQNYLPYIWIQSINASSNLKSVFSSTSNNNGLFEISSDDAEQWQNFGFYSTAIDVIVPPSSNIAIQFAQQNSGITQKQSSTIQKGLMASPSFTGLMQAFDVLTLYQANMPDFFHVNFQVKSIYGNPSAILNAAGTNYTLSSNTNITTFVSSYNLYYEEKNPASNRFLIEYTIQ